MLDDEEFDRRRWRVATFADTTRRHDLVEFLRRHREHIGGWSILATEETAVMLRREAGLKARAIGGDAWGEGLETRPGRALGEIDALIALRDPLTARPDQPGLANLLRLADELNVPVATNLSTAMCLVMGLASKGGVARPLAEPEP